MDTWEASLESYFTGWRDGYAQAVGAALVFSMGDRDIKVGTRRARAIPLAAIGGALFFGALLVRDWRKPKCGAVICATTGPHEPTTPGRNPSPADPRAWRPAEPLIRTRKEP